MIGTKITSLNKWQSKKKLVSTICINTNGECSYETAIRHPDIANGRIIIVKYHKTKANAVHNHSNWVRVIKNGAFRKLHCLFTSCDYVPVRKVKVK